MKAVVLAGGTGTRLQPFTQRTQKQLLPVANKPVIDYVIEDIVATGITDILLVIGGSFPDHVREHFEGHRYAPAITFVEQGKARGLAHAVRCAREAVGDSPFLVYFGDTIVGNEITCQVVDRWEKRLDLYLPLQKVADPSRFGIAAFEDGELVGMHEKPTRPPSSLAYVGVFGASPVLFEHIGEIEPSGRGELELTDALHEMIRGEPAVEWAEVDDTWLDVGTPNDLLEANEAVLSTRISAGAEAVEWADVIGCQPPSARTDDPGSGLIEDVVEIGKQSTVTEDSQIRPPISIGRNTAIRGGATVGPFTSIGNNCLIESATIEGSVVLDGVAIPSGSRVTNSVVDDYAIVEADGRISERAGVGKSVRPTDH